MRCSTHLLPTATHSLGTLALNSSVFQKFDSRIGDISSSYQQLFKKELLSRCTRACADNSYEMTSYLPVLKPSWYADDGLLLPPIDGLKYSIGFLGSTLTYSSMNSRSQILNADNMAQFLLSRGALSLTSRLLSFTSAFIMAEPSNLDIGQGISRWNYAVSSPEGGGLISGDIDSQLALAYILMLPLNIALKVMCLDNIHFHFNRYQRYLMLLPLHFTYLGSRFIAIVFDQSAGFCPSFKSYCCRITSMW